MVSRIGICWPHLDHTHGVVLDQVDVQAKTNEILLFSTLLDRIELTDAIVTAGAIHAQRAHADYLVVQRRAHYVLTVKRNQPHLHDQMKALPWRQIPIGHDARERGHGRDEWRTVKVAAVAAGLDFPHAAQAIRAPQEAMTETSMGALTTALAGRASTWPRAS